VTGRLLDLGLEVLLQSTDLIAFYAELNRSHPL
jgi:hypothetical protein